MDLVELLDAILARIVGQTGAFVALIIVVYFLWRLYRESQKDLRSSDSRVDALTDAVRELTAEVRAKRR
jgi:hypothetical protein